MAVLGAVGLGVLGLAFANGQNDLNGLKSRLSTLEARLSTNQNTAPQNTVTLTDPTAATALGIASRTCQAVRTLKY